MSDHDASAEQPLDHKQFIAELSRLLAGKAAEVRHALIDLAAQTELAPIGAALSHVDALCVLYYQYLHLDADTDGAPQRDRVVCGAAPALPALQPILAELGILPPETSRTPATVQGRAPGVPRLGPCPGMDATAPAPGLGLGLAAGRAMAAQLAGDAWRVYCLLDDEALADGATWEAAHVAAHYKLGNLVVLLNRTGLITHGPTLDVLDPEPVAAKWFSAGWEVIEIAGDSMEHLVWAWETLPAATEPKPVLILAATASGAGVDFMLDDPAWRYAHVNAQTAARAHAALGTGDTPEAQS